MKKILFIAKDLKLGGVSKALINLLKCIDLNKFNITLVTLFADNDYKNKLDSKIKHLILFENNNYLDKFTNKIKGRILRHFNNSLVYDFFIKEKYDIEISFMTNYPNKIIANSSNKDSIKIGWIHGNYNYKNYDLEIYKNLEEQKKTYNKFNHIVCVSSECKDAFSNIVTDKDLITMVNPIDSIEIKELSKEKVSIEKDIFTICSVGRLSEEKGFMRLLKIHKKLIEEGFKYKLWIIGDGPEKNNLINYINKNNLNKHTLLLGYQSNPYKFMVLSDLYVCPSYTEALSTTIQEFLILKKPIVTTSCPGMKDLLGDSKYGIITQNNSDDLYNELKNILINKKKFNYYKEKAVARSSNFNLDKSITDINKLINNFQ
ncbi:glycosyltransferase [Clostridium tarantellae]|uniref:Glycosyltransferase n=1 Tax=Clostridium tarantellae TaxID=39493 RepID=A0A6I1MJH7_9CLOT|nr:glycosyltransferase [Clostridium tarantellae]MPQ42302.1 glycosyltransferase [Clostridium tarantellae]